MKKVYGVEVFIELELEDGEKVKVKQTEAKKIYEELHKLFGEKTVSFYPYTAPYITYPYIPTVYKVEQKPYEVTYTNGTTYSANTTK